MAKYALVIFDWDGTLVDSLATIVHSIQEAAAVLGVPSPSDHAARQVIGLGLPEALSTLFPQITVADRQRLQAHYASHFVAHTPQPLAPFPGIEGLLDDLATAGFELAVATGKSRRGLDRVLGQSGWLPRFTATRCADETRSKPHPQMLHELLSETGYAPDRALMIGDTHFDLAMAQAASVPAVGVTWGAHAPELLSACGPRRLCDDVSSLREAIWEWRDE